MLDLYFEEKYGCLYEKIEGGICEVFFFTDDFGTVRHLFIKKEIPACENDEPYFNITTPYGYGGPVITDYKYGFKKELVRNFKKAFEIFCEENRIISEFVRFHPIISNANDFSDCYNLIFRSKTTGTTLSNFDDPVQEEFSKSTKKSIRKALNAGVECKITVNPKSLSNFKEIYYQTMNRINADELYFFDDAYFSNCQRYFGENIVLVEAIYEGRIIGSELHFQYNNLIHTHLSGTAEEFHHLSPVYVMTYAIVRWGKENGFDIIHSGGGRSEEPDDKLYLFKKKFGKNTEFDYFVSYKVWNEDKYHQLYSAADTNVKAKFFPAYKEQPKLRISH